MSYVDDHCHILPTGLDLAGLDLTACRDLSEVLALVSQRGGDGPVMAHHYDPHRWGGEEATGAMLGDRVVLLRHSNGHSGVASPAAMALAGIGPHDPDPDGGALGRDADGHADGRLVEKAWERAYAALPTPSRAEMTRAVELAATSMASLGIRRAVDMQTGRLALADEIHAYREAETEVRLEFVAEWDAVFGPTGVGPEGLREMAGDRLLGIKLFADGAIGSASAALHQPYLTTGEKGLLIYPPDELTRRVVVASEAGFRVFVHAIGDRALDHVLDAFEATGEPARHRVEHAMILSDAQIERIARLGCALSMQPEFLLRFAPTYARVLGEERARNLFRMRSVLQAGIPLTLSSDRPIVPGDPRDGIRAAVSHPTEAIDEKTANRLYGTEA